MGFYTSITVGARKLLGSEMNDVNHDENVSLCGGYSSSHLHKGADYDARFSLYPGRKLMWELEKQLLAHWFGQISKRDSFLDFAAGTGRILELAAPLFREAIALDISAKMLGVAQGKVPDAKFVCADFRAAPPLLQNKQFDVITAFRFFPNAEPELRHAAMCYLDEHVRPGGVLILNNHETFDSLSYRLMRGLKRGAYSAGMYHAEIVRLVEQTTLRLVEFHSFGVVPQTERKAVLPWWLTRRIEAFNSRFAASRHLLGYNTIYLFQK